ncbi:MAG: glycosyltransferase family 4 protein [Deltaproteobacteria bacterium]|nr:glycosyltransferase family 4 protein [Deltaproteobacteria bacterium]
MNTDIRMRTYVDHLVQIARDEKLDAIHVFGAFVTRPLVGAYAAIKCGLPLIVSFRGADLEVRIFSPALAQLVVALKSAAACVVNSRANQELLTGLLKPEWPVLLAHNHVDPADFSSREDIELNLKRQVIGSMGEFRRLTGLDFLLKAFARLAQRRKDVSLLLIGPFRRIEMGYYSALIEALGCSERIIRTGPVAHESILNYLAACDLMVFPSISDAAPNKILEAMLAGRPIIASNAGGIPELIEHDRDGLLVPPRQTEGIVNAIEALLADPGRGADLARNAQQRVAAEFCPERARADWLGVYEAIGIC